MKMNHYTPLSRRTMATVFRLCYDPMRFMDPRHKPPGSGHYHNESGRKSRESSKTFRAKQKAVAKRRLKKCGRGKTHKKMKDILN